MQLRKTRPMPRRLRSAASKMEFLAVGPALENMHHDRCVPRFTAAERWGDVAGPGYADGRLGWSYGG